MHCYHFEPHQTTFHKKNYNKRLSNFVVYKWPLKIETVVIKLKEIKVPEVLFSEFCDLLSENIEKSRLRQRVVKFLKFSQ